MRNHPSAVRIYSGDKTNNYVIRSFVRLNDEVSLDRDFLFLPNDAPICIFHDFDEESF